MGADHEEGCLRSGMVCQGEELRGGRVVEGIEKTCKPTVRTLPAF